MKEVLLKGWKKATIWVGWDKICKVSCWYKMISFKAVEQVWLKGWKEATFWLGGAKFAKFPVGKKMT